MNKKDYRMKSLLTRPISESIKLKEILQNLGVECFIEPVIEIKPLIKMIIFEKSYPILITSSNALKLIATYNINKNSKLLIVGENSALIARNLGFNNIIYVAENVKSLIRFIINNPSEYSNIYYPRSSHINFDLKKYLQDFCIIVHEHILYEAKAINNFSKQTLELLSKNFINIAVFFSSRTAEIFLSLINQYGLEKSLKNITAYSISINVANILSGYKWQNIEVAKKQNQQAIIELFNARIAKTRY